MKKIYFLTFVFLFTVNTNVTAQRKINKTTNSKVPALSTNELSQGKWQSMDDKSYFVTFDKNKTNLFNGCGDDNCVTFSLEEYAKFGKIVCDQDVFCSYRIIAINRDFLTLSTDGSGGDIFKYKRVKG